MKGSLAYERLHANLQALNLATVERGIDVALENGAKGAHLLTEVFDDLVDREVKARQALSTETRVRLAGFPVRKRLEEFDFEFQPSVDPTLIQELATMRFVHNAENVILVGPAGVGKTHLAIALGMEAAKAGFSVTFMSASRALGKLRQAMDRGLLERTLRNLCRSRLLILDEIGYLPWDRTMAHLFFRIVENRCERASTLFTSNKAFSEWARCSGTRCWPPRCSIGSSITPRRSTFEGRAIACGCGGRPAPPPLWCRWNRKNGSTRQRANDEGRCLNRSGEKSKPRSGEITRPIDIRSTVRAAVAESVAVEGVSEAGCALLAVIGAKRARRARAARFERDASPCPHHAAGASEIHLAERAPRLDVGRARPMTGLR